MTIKKFLFCTCLLCLCACTAQKKSFSFTQEQLLNKIKGGWAAQTVGCTYGGPTEFVYRERIIPDSIDLTPQEGCMLHFFQNAPGLYDDIYMDLTFVDVFKRLGMKAPVDSFATAFATADYMLWHANQAARYNILHGMKAPESGFWKNNPHADDIDFQIEADFAGLMCPGMPQSAAAICDKIGHIMNYGNGYYGGVYIAAMYALAFTTDDLWEIATQALKSIPSESTFAQAMQDVLDWSRQNPDDWQLTWQLCQEKWGTEIGCPEGVFRPLNIDALINCAYVLIGLLYGEEDFEKTMEIATRCGQDSDCNPASAAGILGVVKGYDALPDFWLRELQTVEDIPFKYTTLSLNNVYALSMEQALEMIGRGKSSETIRIRPQQPKAVPLEVSFDGLRPKTFDPMSEALTDNTIITFEGAGVVLCGHVKSTDPNYVAKIAASVDGQQETIIEMSALTTTRRLDVYWNYDLAAGIHQLSLRWLNPFSDASVQLTGLLTYDATQK